ncbi:hypothetical protein CsSME_00015974 [Camellia sinensis var. sinensis]
MAATASPMASQLRSSFGISAAPLRVLPCRRNSSFTIKAVQTDKVRRERLLLSKLFSPSMVTHLSGASRLR